MTCQVAKVEYVRIDKHLLVLFDDGSAKTYRVDPPAADAMLASGSLQGHYEKYIKPVYHELLELEERI